eukprot:716731-Rhodomonas_salina.2
MEGDGVVFGCCHHKVGECRDGMHDHLPLVYFCFDLSNLQGRVITWSVCCVRKKGHAKIYSRQPA